MVCLSVLGSGLTSGTCIRARKFKAIFTEQGVKVMSVDPIVQRKIHPLVNFILNLILALPQLVIKCDLVYSISDLLPDAMFGILYKLTHPNIKFTCGCHSLVQRHIIGRTPLHSFYSYYSQQVILWLLKRTANRVLVSNDYDRKILLSKGFKEVVTVYAAPNI